MENKKFIMDTETGGFSSSFDGLCSVALKVYGKDISENIFIKPDPELNYHSGAEKVHGLTEKWLEENGITELEAIKKIKSFISKNFNEIPDLIGQNISFDTKFVDSLFRRNRMGPFAQLYLGTEDTMFRTRRLVKRYGLDCANSKLGTAYKFFTGKEPENTHDAMGDVLMTEELYKKQEEFMESKQNE